jgi:hypothetical protein
MRVVPPVEEEDLPHPRRAGERPVRFCLRPGESARGSHDARGAAEDRLLVARRPPSKACSSRSARKRVEAAKSVAMIDLALLQAELANGMYKKPIELLGRRSITSRCRRK